MEPVDAAFKEAIVKEDDLGLSVHSVIQPSLPHSTTVAVTRITNPGVLPAGASSAVAGDTFHYIKFNLKLSIDRCCIRLNRKLFRNE